jgi:pimeloyl-ACP methyl ester carboxylesterase
VTWTIGAVRPFTTLFGSSFDDGVATVAKSALLEWRQTDVWGRVASYGVGGSGPSIVFLHGWGLSGHTYKAALKRLLARGFRVWAPALPGFNGSSALGPGVGDLAQYAAWVAEFLEVVGVAQPVVMMGHSFGGGVAIQTAHDWPERVGGLVLINSIGGSAWRRQGSLMKSMAQRPLWDWGLHFPSDVLPLRQLRRVLPVVLEAAVPNALRDPRAFWHAASIARYADLTDELQELKARRLPVVVLWGSRDEIVTRASFDALMECLGNPMSITVEGSHSWLLADPDTFGEVITNVLPVIMSAHAEAPDQPVEEIAELTPNNGNSHAA